MVKAHLERVADVVAAQPEQDVKTVQSVPNLQGQIELKEVSFSYAPDKPLALAGINLTIKPGQRVAIVGRTGSGKSTLGKLLLGLYQPNIGEIFYDGLALSQLNFQELRSQFGVVLQESFIFSGTIRDNISFSHPEMDMGQVVEAARLAALQPDIDEMPMSYETMVAEGGNALSGGQRQRLALARAIAHKPAILLLDEATSHLDVVTEQVVAQNLNVLASTQIIIAHRLSTVRNADLIVVMDHGTVVEQGTHAELLNQHGYYAALVHSQEEQ
jgi:ABC-type bacteriocin/lantibiotic exporter with double-glycine peptidase domain